MSENSSIDFHRDINQIEADGGFIWNFAIPELYEHTDLD